MRASARERSHRAPPAAALRDCREIPPPRLPGSSSCLHLQWSAQIRMKLSEKHSPRECIRIFKNKLKGCRIGGLGSPAFTGGVETAAQTESAGFEFGGAIFLHSLALISITSQRINREGIFVEMIYQVEDPGKSGSGKLAFAP